MIISNIADTYKVLSGAPQALYSVEVIYSLNIFVLTMFQMGKGEARRLGDNL